MADKPKKNRSASFRTTDRAKYQLDFLQTVLGVNQSEVINHCINHVYHQTKKEFNKQHVFNFKDLPDLG